MGTDVSHLNGFGLQVTRQCQKTLKVREASGGVGVEWRVEGGISPLNDFKKKKKKKKKRHRGR